MTDDQRLNAYARWISDNRDKKGTADFEKVADAYRTLRTKQRPASPAEPPQPTSNPVMGAVARAAELGSNLAQAGGLPPVFAGGALTAEDLGVAEQFNEGNRQLGSVLEKAQQAVNYQPAEDATWEGFKANPSLGSLLKFGVTQGIVSAPDMVASLIPATLAPYVVSRTRELAEERAIADGRPGDVQATDVAAGFGTALASAGLERLGAKAVLMPKATGIVGRTGNALVKETATEAAQEGAEAIGTTAGTETGVDPGTVVDRMAAGAVGGGVAAGAYRGAAETARGAAAVPGMAQRAREGIRYSANPHQVASDLRVADLYERRKATIEKQDGGKTATSDEVFKGVQDDLEHALTKTADALTAAGDLNKEGRDAVRRAISVAKRHNRALGTEGEPIGYFETELDMLDGLGLPAETVDTFKRALRDLETASFNGMKKNRTGPAERMAKNVVAPVAGAIAGGTAAGPLGALAGGVAARTGTAAALAGHAGRAVDTILGTREAPVLQRLRARRDMAAQRGIDYGDSVAEVSAVHQDATERTAGATILPKNYLLQRSRQKVAQQERQAAKEAREAEVTATKAAREATAREKAATTAQRKAEAAAAKAQAAADKTAAKMAQVEADAAARAAKQEAEATAKVARDAAKAAEKADKAEQARMAREAAAAEKTARDAQQRADKAEARRAAVEAREQAKSQAEVAKKEAQAAREAEKAAAKAAKAAAAQEAKAAAAEAEAQRNEARGTTAERIGAKRRGGWAASMVQHGRAAGLDMTEADVKAALDEFVADGRFTAEEADDLLKVPGARVTKEADFYEIADIAMEFAERRGGAASAGPDRPTSGTVPSGDGVRNPQAYQTALDRYQDATRGAREKAPNDALAGYASKVADARTRASKAALVAQAEAEHPEHAQWVEDNLQPLVELLGEPGGRGEAAKPAKAKRGAPNGALADYASMIADARTRTAKKALLAQALAEHPEHERWIGDNLRPLVDMLREPGGGGT